MDTCSCMKEELKGCCGKDKGQLNPMCESWIVSCLPLTVAIWRYQLTFCISLCICNMKIRTRLMVFKCFSLNRKPTYNIQYYTNSNIYLNILFSLSEIGKSRTFSSLNFNFLFPKSVLHYWNPVVLSLICYLALWLYHSPNKTFESVVSFGKHFENFGDGCGSVGNHSR